MEAAHPGAEKATLIIVLLFTWAFPDALKIPNYTSTILSQPAEQDWLPTASRSNAQQFNFTTSTILEGKQDLPHTPCCCNCLANRNRKAQAVLGALGEKQSYTRWDKLVWHQTTAVRWQQYSVNINQYWLCSQAFWLLVSNERHCLKTLQQESSKNWRSET